MRPSRSAIFTVYNALRSRYRAEGRNTSRLNRGLGLCLLRTGADRLAHYATAEGRCLCKDQWFRMRWGPCKHQVALSIITVAGEIDALNREEVA